VAGSPLATREEPYLEERRRPAAPGCTRDVAYGSLPDAVMRLGRARVARHQIESVSGQNDPVLAPTRMKERYLGGPGGTRPT
jgi:hypothetical protein